MEEQPKKNNNAPKGGPPSRFQPKVFIIWLVILAAIIGIMHLNTQPMGQTKKLNISELVGALQAREVSSLTLLLQSTSSGMDYYNITGTFNKSESENVLSGEGKPENTSEGLNDSSTEKGLPATHFTASGRLTDAKLDQIRTLAFEQNIDYEEPPASTLMRDLIFTLLPFILIIGLLYFLFMRQIKMAGKGAMTFGKSKARMLTRDRERVTFKAVAGCDEAKKDVSEIVDFLKDPKKFQKIGGRVPKGILMVGPPGTGKTLLGKAVAGEADVPFFSISGSDFVEMFVGVGAARVRDMFEQGRKSAPCIIFIDEIDAVGRQRGAGLGGGNDEREQTLNSLLVEMDGFDSHEGVIIIAATNRPDVLDSALLRPGRFDRQIHVDLPDMHGREDILKVHAKKIKMDEAVDLSVVARNTPGFSGADLANLLNEGALIAARHSRKHVQMIHLEEAREKIAFGAERRKLMDDEDKRMTAYHEAGHALVQVVIGDKDVDLHKVTIIPRGRALGLTMMLPRKDMLGMSRKQLLNQICMAMAGRIGEEVATGDYSNGASSDIKQATRIARHMVCDWGMSELGPIALGENQDHIFLGKEIARNQNYSEDTARQIDAAIHEIISVQYKRAEEIVGARREALVKIADALLEYETLEGKHVHEILEHGEIQTEVLTMHNQPEDADSSDDDEKEKSPKDKESKDSDELGPETSAGTCVGSSCDGKEHGLSSVLLIVLGLIALRFAVSQSLEVLNRRHVRAHASEIPEAFRGWMDEDTYRKSVDYTLEKSRFGAKEEFYDTAILVTLLATGWLAALYGWFVGLLGTGLWGGALTLVLVGLVLGLPSLPWEWVGQFRLEARFGFNKSSPGLWVSDKLKGMVLGMVIGTPVLAAILYFFTQFPESWWIWASGTLVAFQLVMLVLYPMLIVPLFNKLTPLPEGALRDRLIALGERAGFCVKSIQVIDGSKRSGHSNAYFTGFGKFRRIVLYDTLIEQLSEEELEAVLAHEIGHYKRGHIPKMLFMAAASIVLSFWVLNLLIHESAFYTAFGFSEDAGVLPALLLFSLLSSVVTFWMSPLMSRLSRKHEYEADAFAREMTGGADSLIASLRKLHEKNLSNLNPHPLYSAFYYSHPTLLERERTLRKG